MKGMWQSHCHYEFPSPSSIVLSCEPSCYTPSIKLNSSLMSCYFISCFSWTYQQHKFAVKITNLFKCLNRNLNIFLQVDFLLGLLIPLMCTEPWIKVFGYCATTFEPYMLQTWNNLWFSTCLNTPALTTLCTVVTLNMTRHPTITAGQTFDTTLVHLSCC